MFLLRLYPWKVRGVRHFDDYCTMLHGEAAVNKNVISGNGLRENKRTANSNTSNDQGAIDFIDMLEGVIGWLKNKASAGSKSLVGAG